MTRTTIEPPLANPHEPRLRLVQTNLSDEFTGNTVDTDIGATIGLVRVTDVSGLAVQQDVFAAVQPRFSRHHLLIASDYRFGFPVTFAYGPWEAKVGYEHTSTHQGDGSIEVLGRRLDGQVRDEGVIGLARWLAHDHFRVYGQAGYATLSTPGPDKDPSRYDWGVEYSPKRSKGWWGEPFAAFDMELRGDQNFDANMTTQVGWQWRELGQRLSSIRVGLEYYDGRSPFGTFFFQKEHWVGVGVYVDF